MSISDLIALNVLSGTKNNLRETEIRFTSSIACTTSEIYDYWDGSTVPGERGGHTTVPYNNTIVMFGGYTGWPTALFYNDLWQYDITTRTWSTLPNISGPSTRYAHHSAIINTDEMLIFGGWSGSTFLNDLWKYKITTGIWSNPPNVSPPPVRQNHAADMVGTDMIIFGGYNGAFLNDVWKYDTLAQTWTLLANNGTPPSARSNTTATSDANNIYLFGGQTASGIANDFFQYNVPTQTWSQLTTVGGPTARLWHSFETIGNNLFMYGGSATANGTALDEIWKYNILSSTWSQVTTGTRPKIPRMFHTSIAIGNIMYIVAGYPTGGLGVLGLQDIWEADYSALTINHTQLRSGPMYIISTSFILNNVIFTTSVVGGNAVLNIKSQTTTPNTTSMTFQTFRLKTV